MFGKDFRFGTGISSYQVEGAYQGDGKDLSIWDVFTHQKGTIKDGTDGDVALDFYHRYPEDLDLAKELGIQDFRFSLSWPRVVHEDGSVNRKGVVFYISLIEEIKKRGRNPVRTIYHWDRPLWLEKKGGFYPRSCLKDWENYRKVVCRYFAPIRKDFISFNEPQCFLFLGFHKGGHAPNKDCSYEELCQCAHHVLLCHALAFKRIKEVNPDASIGFVNTFNAPIPMEKNPILIEKRKELLFAYPKKADDFYTVSIYRDPLYLGEYPSGYADSVKTFSSFVLPGDRELIRKAKPDTVDCNIYTGRFYKLDKDGNAVEADFSLKGEDSDLGWLKKRPSSVYYGPWLRYDRYHLPVLITENGGCYKDVVKDGKVHDEERCAYLQEYLDEIFRAIEDGVPIKGYYYWSLLDNFEWAEGYKKRFGLVYVDYKDGLKRIKKDSFDLYQRLIKEIK